MAIGKLRNGLGQESVEFFVQFGVFDLEIEKVFIDGDGFFVGGFDGFNLFFQIVISFNLIGFLEFFELGADAGQLVGQGEIFVCKEIGW